MTTLSALKPFFIFEMANNHMGSVDHGLKIIREMKEVSRDFPFHFGIKLQYRQLDTFIHPDFKGREDVKYVKRFSETKLSKDDYKRLKDEIVNVGFVAVCTPFDEESVDVIEEHGFDIIKIASCSFTDWRLLERIVQTDKPIIASTAGASIEDIDRVVSFLEHREKDFALMHCVAQYPTPRKDIQLNQIDLFRNRYPGVIVGYSTHESPDEVEMIKLAIAKGAAIFEKHVGVPTDSIKLNDYSATPEQATKWVETARHTLELCGVSDKRPDFTEKELKSLHELRRGVYAKTALPAGHKLAADDVFLAMPVQEGQLTAPDLSKYTEFVLQKPVDANAALFTKNVKSADIRETVYSIIGRVKELLAESKVVSPNKADFEVSHHYGIDKFDEYGITMITVINRDYCKKLIIMLPGQKHPEQYHTVKEETFHVLYGEVEMILDGKESICRRGDIVVVEREMRHSFSTKTGAVIEELSSTHLVADSYYTDPTILDNKNRKTLLTHWLD